MNSILDSKKIEESIIRLERLQKNEELLNDEMKQCMQVLLENYHTKNTEMLEEIKNSIQNNCDVIQKNHEKNWNLFKDKVKEYATIAQKNQEILLNMDGDSHE